MKSDRLSAQGFVNLHRKLLFRLMAVGLAAYLFWDPNPWKLSDFAILSLQLAGALLMVAGILGRGLATISIGGHKDKTIMQTELYSICRNPLYFFSMIGALGVALMTHTLTIPVLVLLSFAIYYPNVIRAEEADLTRIHGAPFEVYRGQTPAFFPRWSLLKEPDTYQVKPRVFRNHMGSAVWFILAIGLIALLQAARAAGQIPALISLY